MAKIILRLDLNVPLEKGKILETLKIDVILPDLKRLLKTNQVTVLSHLGKGSKGETLKPIEAYIRKKLTKNENQNLTVLENTRFLKGETAKVGSREFKKATEYFASFGDIYIDDAFSTMHRANASIIGIPKLFKQEGKKVELGRYAKSEIEHLEKFLKLAKNHGSQTLLILGGVKISTKLPLIKKFLKYGCSVFLGGGSANQVMRDILKLKIGQSYYEKNFTFKETEKKYLLTAYQKGKLFLPTDVELKNKQIKSVENLQKSDYICDLGPKSLENLKTETKKVKTIIFNGPLGLYNQGFPQSTVKTLKILQKFSGAVLIGGGDTLVLVEKIRLKNTKKLYISTAGGAMLEFLTHDGNLPGISVLK